MLRLFVLGLFAYSSLATAQTEPTKSTDRKAQYHLKKKKKLQTYAMETNTRRWVATSDLFIQRILINEWDAAVHGLGFSLGGEGRQPITEDMFLFLGSRFRASYLMGSYEKSGVTRDYTLSPIMLGVNGGLGGFIGTYQYQFSMGFDFAVLGGGVANMQTRPGSRADLEFSLDYFGLFNLGTRVFVPFKNGLHLGGGFDYLTGGATLQFDDIVMNKADTSGLILAASAIYSF